MTAASMLLSATYDISTGIISEPFDVWTIISTIVLSFLVVLRQAGDTDTPVSRDHHDLAAFFTGQIV
jgi:hypothetical protein